MSLEHQDKKIFKRFVPSLSDKSTRINREYGRPSYVTEVEAKEIKAINKARQTADKKRCLLVARRIEDHQTARSLNISVTELNHGGVYQ